MSQGKRRPLAAAEQVAAENGFQEDPYDRLAYLTAQIFRAVDQWIESRRPTTERQGPIG